MSKKEKLIIFDAHALIHRAFHALPPLRTKEGELVGAIYGYAATLIKVISQFKPDYVVACFDYPAPTFRHKKFAAYKATRVKAPDELYEQIPKVKEMVRAFNMPLLEKEGLEADDLIATIAKKAGEEGLQTTIVTGDLDALQLVDKNTKVFTIRRGIQDTVLYDEVEVVKKLGVKPSQVPDYKGLRGDASDNIPGVPGIGEKTASALISKYGNLENLYKNIKIDSEFSQNLKELLAKHKAQAFLSRELATAVKDAKISFRLKDAKVHEFDEAKVFRLFRRWEFRSLIARIPELQGLGQGKLFSEEEGQKEFSNNREKDLKYHIVSTEKDFDEFLGKLKKQKLFSFDTETTSLAVLDAKLVGLSFSFTPKEAYYLPVGHKEGANLNLNKVLEVLRPIFSNTKIAKCGHNIKYDIMVLGNYGLEVSGELFDSMVASYLLHPNLRSHSLDDLAFAEFGIKTTKLGELLVKKFGKTKKPGPNEQIPTDLLSTKDLGEYSCEDADLAMRFRKSLEEKLKKEKLWQLFREIEMPLVPVLADLEKNGVLLDVKFLEKLSGQLAEKINKLEKAIYTKAGQEFNIKSPKQLSQMLFNVLGFSKEKVKKTKTGISTAASELEKMKNHHPIISNILEYRELAKLKNTYVDALPALISQKDGRIHTSFNQTITATGRLSSSNPNLQNIPIRTEIGNEIRKAFVAQPGYPSAAPTSRAYKLVSADYSQIELRILAHISSDKDMIGAFLHQKDIHAITAAQIFGKPIDKITKEERRVAKTINFGIIYGMSANSLSNEVGIPYKQADEFIKKYFSHRPGVTKYIKDAIAKTTKTGISKTLFGRIRQIPEITSSNFIVRSAAERAAVNTPLQGTAADLMKIAMINIINGLSKVSSEAKMILQVHDELVFEVPEPDVLAVAKFAKDQMEKAHKFKVPITVDVSVGKNWGEMEELKR